MTTYSSLLRLTLQDVGENSTTWGTVANNGVFKLLEDAIAGLASIGLAGGNVTLSSNNGSTDQSREMILSLTGALGAARSVTVPSLSKVYLVINLTTGAQNVTVKTAAGSGVVIPSTGAVWVYCDGVDCFLAKVGAADLATTATTAANATALGGVAAASYARLDAQQGFTKGQNSTRVTLTESGGLVAVNASLSNAFYLAMSGNWTLSNPSAGLDGQPIRLIIKQDGTGSRVITWGAKYKFPGGVAPILSTAPNARDYFAFEYFLADDVWVGNGIKGLA